LGVSGPLLQELFPSPASSYYARTDG